MIKSPLTKIVFATLLFLGSTLPSVAGTYWTTEEFIDDIIPYNGFVRVSLQGVESVDIQGTCTERFLLILFSNSGSDAHYALVLTAMANGLKIKIQYSDDSCHASWGKNYSVISQISYDSGGQ